MRQDVWPLERGAEIGVEAGQLLLKCGLAFFWPFFAFFLASFLLFRTISWRLNSSWRRQVPVKKYLSQASPQSKLNDTIYCTVLHCADIEGH